MQKKSAFSFFKFQDSFFGTHFGQLGKSTSTFWLKATFNKEKISCHIKYCVKFNEKVFLSCSTPRDVPLSDFSQAKWKFEKMDCIEPDVPMVDICSYKPDCLFKNNIFCNKFKSMRFFLHAFSAMRHDQHCLAFAFTYRETSDFQGIAWIKVSKFVYKYEMRFV